MKILDCPSAKPVWTLVNCPRCESGMWLSCTLPAKPGKIREAAPKPHRERLKRATELGLLVKKVEKRTIGRLWGQKRVFTPRVLGTAFGDGKKIIWMTSINVRPAYWVIRVDSSWCLDNCEHPDGKLESPREWLENVYQAIEEEFGTGEKDNGELYADAKFPQACDLGMGTFWGEMKELEGVLCRTS